MSPSEEEAHLIDHGIVDVLIIQNDKFLVVQEGKPGREGLYNLPGGHVEAHETLFAAAVREAKEETGYDVELTGVVGFYQALYPHLNVAGPVLSAKIIGGGAVSTPEHPDSKWVTRDELHQMAHSGKLFTKYPPYAVDHYLARGAFPLDIVASYDYTQAKRRLN